MEIVYILGAVVTIIILYILISLAYVRRRKAAFLSMQSEMRVGDTALVAHSIYGKIVGLDSRTVKLEVAEGIVLTCDRAAVLVPPAEPAPEKKSIGH